MGSLLDTTVWNKVSWGVQCGMWDVGCFQSCVVGCVKEGYGTGPVTR
jgi:hypothetical protein